MSEHDEPGMSGDKDGVAQIGRDMSPGERHRQQLAVQAMLVSVAAMVGLVSILLLIFQYEISRYTVFKQPTTLLLGATGLVTSVSMLLFLYLRGWVPREAPKRSTYVDYFPAEKTSSDNSVISDLVDRVEALEQAPLTPVGVTPADVAQMLLPQVQTDLAKAFEGKYEQKSAVSRATVLNGQRYNAAVKRLEQEIKDQGRKGNVNLIIGVATTLLAVGLLAWIVLAQENPDWAKVNPTWTQLVAHYIPRLSLVIFIEVFSFFFLRLYKATLEEARRYNDDLTRLTLQWVATETGMHAEEKGAIAALAKELLAVSKPPKLASAEATKADFDDEKLIKTLTGTITKQIGAEAKKGAKVKAKTEKEDE